MPDTAVLVGGIVIVLGVAVAAVMFIKDRPLSAPPKLAKASSKNLPQAVAARDSLGQLVYPEYFEMGQLDKKDRCAWMGCIGELDDNGNCTNCPPM